MLTAMKCSGQHAVISGSNILFVCITFIEFKNVNFVVSFSYFLSFSEPLVQCFQVTKLNIFCFAVSK